MMMRRHGYEADVDAINERYQRAYKAHKTNEELRYVGDGKEFWRVVVGEAVACQDPSVFEDIYTFYELPAAWKVGHGSRGRCALLLGCAARWAEPLRLAVGCSPASTCRSRLAPSLPFVSSGGTASRLPC